jgi:hypothetical protein
MFHFAEGVLQAYLDGEDVADARAQVAAHVSDCADCAARLQDLRDSSAVFASAIRALDVQPLPMAALAELRVRGQQRDWVERMRGARRPLIRAAILVVGIAVATVPGSPVRAWLVDAWNALTRTEEPAVTDRDEKPEAPPELAGAFSTVPEGGQVRILLQRAGSETRVHVVLVDSARVTVEVLGAVSVRGTKAQGLIQVDAAGVPEFRVLLPRTLKLGTVEVNGRTYVRTQGAELRYEGPQGTADTTPSELIFRPAR